MSDLYRVIGVRAGADQAQVKSAYRRLAKTWHPDLNGGDKRAERRFVEISCAYATLGDPEARAEYDSACAAHRAMLRRQVRNAAATMSASFVLTISAGYFLAGWLSDSQLFF